MMKLNSNSKKNIHFIGIGGSGMFPIVQILHSYGHNISGSDLEDSPTLKLENNMDVIIYDKHSKDHVNKADLVIYSAAISDENPELAEAKKLGIPTLKRAEILGMLTNQYNNSVCIAGTHGKTTTTALLTQILLENKLDTTAIIGGVLPSINGNGHAGKSDTIVCEACEYANTFLYLKSDISVILNIDNDHLEFFESLENLISVFSKFGEQTNKVIICNGDDVNTMSAVKGLSKNIVTFGLNESNIYCAKNVNKLSTHLTAFGLYFNNDKICDIKLNLLGIHNIYNTMAACICALTLGIKPSELQTPINNFNGVKRRFETLYSSPTLTIIDDYAHHPTQISTILKAVKQLSFRHTWIVFQPHTFSRTKILLNDFASVLNLVDHCIITDIIGSRETDTLGISSLDLQCKIKNSICISDFGQIADYIIENAPSNTLVLTLGAGGNFYKVADKLINKLKVAQK